MLADRSHLSFDWLEIEDDNESFAALSALPRTEKEALFAACVARTVKGQLAFVPQARPEFEATVARLDIDFAKHVRPTGPMLWSRICGGPLSAGHPCPGLLPATATVLSRRFELVLCRHVPPARVMALKNPTFDLMTGPTCISQEPADRSNLQSAETPDGSGNPSGYRDPTRDLR